MLSLRVDTTDSSPSRNQIIRTPRPHPISLGAAFADAPIPAKWPHFDVVMTPTAPAAVNIDGESMMSHALQMHQRIGSTQSPLPSIDSPGQQCQSVVDSDSALDVEYVPDTRLFKRSNKWFQPACRNSNNNRTLSSSSDTHPLTPLSNNAACKATRQMVMKENKKAMTKARAFDRDGQWKEQYTRSEIGRHRDMYDACE
jgi:hypothetical protein